MNLLQSVLYGFLSGIADIVPVSSRAHGILLLKIFGTTVDSNFVLLFFHVGVLLALYTSSVSNLTRIRRALALARVPKKKRRRPLDMKSLMDFRLLRTMAVPIILAYLFYGKAYAMGANHWLVAIFLFVNGVVLYIPQWLPTGNKDARSMSRVDGLLIGLGGAVSILPGMSYMGGMLSVGSVCGVDKQYNLDNALIAGILVNLCIVVSDLLRMLDAGLTGITFQIVLTCLATGAAAFGGTLLGVKILRNFTKSGSYTLFSFYCWGLALFTFFLNLVA